MFRTSLRDSSIRTAMWLFITSNQEAVHVLAKGPDINGELEQIVRPGEFFGKLSYSVLRQAGDGVHEYDTLAEHS